ncbi:MAG: 2-amino-4-hydroxy-6-hydroxymethyldihydropteridine diphosphokinase [Piscirickettsiaceae bacterium]|nr:2-amino-4-hydroxy-6-hydroxymethyldihydropteridine diphosphokinase [Piscirickettsiaceae bacterium]
MPPSQSGYLLGIGSNIDPHQNIAQIIPLLLEKFPTLTLSRVLEIPPIGMNSQRDFLNVVMFIETDILEGELKAICNSIEIQRGRDRSDPHRGTKDRSADLDILTAIHFPDDANRPAHSITDEYFLYPLLDEISAYLMQSPFEIQQKGVEINIGHLTFGQAATTIHRDASTRDKRIV